MNRIRILVIEMQTMMRDIVKAMVSAQPDMQIVAECETRDELPAAAERARPDVVVLELTESELAHEYVDLMYAQSSVRIVGLRLEGGSAAGYEMRPHEVIVHDISHHGLLELIRGLGTSAVAGREITEPTR